MDGASMEPSGRNRWQPVANGTPPKRLNQADPQPVATRGNGSADGKEGVDGSSPSEGFGFPPAQPAIPLSRLAAVAGFDVRAASTSVHRGRSRAELVDPA